jgi:hypothetical protein
MNLIERYYSAATDLEILKKVKRVRGWYCKNRERRNEFYCSLVLKSNYGK